MKKYELKRGCGEWGGEGGRVSNSLCGPLWNDSDWNVWLLSRWGELGLLWIGETEKSKWVCELTGVITPGSDVGWGEWNIFKSIFKRSWYWIEDTIRFSSESCNFNKVKRRERSSSIACFEIAWSTVNRSLRVDVLLQLIKEVWKYTNKYDLNKLIEQQNYQ